MPAPSLTKCSVFLFMATCFVGSLSSRVNSNDVLGPDLEGVMKEWVIGQRVQYFSDRQEKWYAGSVTAIDTNGNIDVNVNGAGKKTVPANEVARRLKDPEAKGDNPGPKLSRTLGSKHLGGDGHVEDDVWVQGEKKEKKPKPKLTKTKGSKHLAPLWIPGQVEGDKLTPGLDNKKEPRQGRRGLDRTTLICDLNPTCAENARKIISGIEQTGRVPEEAILKSFLEDQNKFNAKLDNLQQLRAASTGKVFVIGDIHGQLDQLLYIMGATKRMVEAEAAAGEHTGTKEEESQTGSQFLTCAPDVHYVFLGDYVDRGVGDVQVAALVLAYRAMCPARENRGVILLRGNHEDTNINEAYGFKDNFLSHYGGNQAESMWALISAAWTTLPIAASLNEKVLFVHGGLVPASLHGHNKTKALSGFSAFAEFLNSIPHIGVKNDVPEHEENVLWEMMWADPGRIRSKGKHNLWGASSRGYSYVFSANAMASFTRATGVELIIRGHQAEADGYRGQFKVLTVFSAANYGGSRSQGAFAELSVKSPLSPTLHTHTVSAEGDVTPSPQGPLLPGSYALMQRRQSFASSLHDIAAQLTEQPNSTRLIATCDQLNGVQEKVQAQATAILEADQKDAAGNNAKFVQETVLDVDELGEAWPVVRDMKTRERLTCLSAMVGKAVENVLVTSGIATKHDAAVLDSEAQFKVQQVATVEGGDATVPSLSDEEIHRLVDSTLNA